MVAFGAQSLVDERGISSVEDALLGTPKLHCWGGLPVSSFPHSSGVGEKRLRGDPLPPGPQLAWSPGFHGCSLIPSTAEGTAAKLLLPGAPTFRPADSSSPQAFSIFFTDFFFLWLGHLNQPKNHVLCPWEGQQRSLGSHLSCPCRGVIFSPQFHSEQASWALVLYWKQPPSRTRVGSKSGPEQNHG